MKNIKNLLTLTDSVKTILEKDPIAREDDFRLYCLTITQMGLKLPKFKSFLNVLINHTEYNLPPFESVSRARRKICSLYPNLKGNNDNKRTEEITIYKEFSRIKNI